MKTFEFKPGTPTLLGRLEANVEAKIRALFSDVASRYIGVPGLIRKYFGFSPDASEVVGIYLWDSKGDADAFYSPEWLSGVTQRWGAAPKKSEWIVPVVAESFEGAIVTE